MSRSAFSVACKVVGWYGIGFGLATVPGALFMGSQFLIASLMHIAMGAVFLRSASGIEHGKAWASWVTMTCSGVIAGLGMFAVRESLEPVQASDLFFQTSNLVFYAFISLFFTCLVFAAVREVRNLALSQYRRSP